MPQQAASEMPAPSLIDPGALGTPADLPAPTEILDQGAAAIQTLLSLGGPVVIVLALLSIVALAIVLLKLWQFFRAGIGRTRRVQRSIKLWCDGDSKGAMALLAGRRQPLARIAYLAMSGRVQGIRESRLREELVRVASDQLETLRAYLRPLDVIATLSPLLGLLGTVLGMIEAFQQLETAGTQVDPAILSGGIWQALMTTAVGLGVAIPTVIAHTWLERRVEGYGHRMEDSITRIFTRELRGSSRRREPA